MNFLPNSRCNQVFGGRKSGGDRDKGSSREGITKFYVHSLKQYNSCVMTIAPEELLWNSRMSKPCIMAELLAKCVRICRTFGSDRSINHNSTAKYFCCAFTHSSHWKCL
jgi:hypothetical protein